MSCDLSQYAVRTLASQSVTVLWGVLGYLLGKDRGEEEQGRDGISLASRLIASERRVQHALFNRDTRLTNGACSHLSTV